MKKLGRRNYYAKGSKKFEAWYNAMTNDKMYEIEVRRHKNFDWWDETDLVFDFNGKTYSECGIDNFNGHFSGYTDRAALYGVYLREVVEA
ncbi:MAG TPA: hypothetical protein VK982_01745 [Bacteroidales bacterium]|nr:hypothetical protein [Bacteroidales bacterium]